MQKIVYQMCKNKIQFDMYETQEYMQLMLDVFFAGERITVEHYQELRQLLKGKHEEE